MFRILIKDLNLFGYHGVRDSEKKDGQNFRFNIEILINKGSFLNDDSIENTINYSEVIRLVKDINSNRRFNLLETLSQEIANRIIGMSFLIEKVSVKIEKTSPPIKENIESVGVEYILDRKSVEGSGKSKLESSEVNVYMSLGSNIRNRENNLRKAVDLIGRNSNINIIKVSSIYETEPMYLKDQNYFYNIVLQAQVNGKVSPFEMIGFLKGIEYGFGRKRSEKRYGPRIIDIDLLYYGEMVIESDFFTVPHPGIEERKFVLVPLSEIAPELKIKSRNIGKFIADCNLTEKVKLIKNW
ncbi:MAG: 2-amino-4-hydroxy-6-hydroxymethyldihydropteridine pyrophosphokinase [Candidatus Hydromicrobium americanum]|nr:MAG: 2-amino-4-hydroxy-6-hydroxymethyldihydropteridine pyrophosphokinase [Candidatus Hydromicrobium americanum]